MAARPPTLDRQCYLSPHTERLLKKAVAEGNGIDLNINIQGKCISNYIIPLTSSQCDLLDKRIAKGGTGVRIELSKDQAKRCVLIRADLVKKEAPKSIASNLQDTTLSELIKMYEDLRVAINQKLASDLEKDKRDVMVLLENATGVSSKVIEEAAPAEPIPKFAISPCKVSYSEKLHCPKCRKKTDNDNVELNEIEEDGVKRHRVTGTCVICSRSKSKKVEMKNATKNGLISFI